ncbi:GNAT family N-acyltransferase [Marinomonas sp. THO17]|uniref:lysophospholipid acyltransferase family protein n=1 Tax=Marinomonas sp. THO17 TaxID=3149048 RepID=UPI00336BFF75
MIDSPFRLPRVTPFGLAEKCVEWLTGLSKLDALYQQRTPTQSSFEFMNYTLKALEIDYQLASGSLQNIPQKGPVVIVANHPLGAIEGVILADLLASVRQDVKVLANEMLKRLPEIRDLFIGVNVFGGSKAAKTNSMAIREANQHLADGGVLVIFPAGEVSTYPKGSRVLADAEWRHSVAKFINRSQAAVVPIFIDGQNSPMFYRAGRIHPLLRTAMLAKELLNKRASKIRLSIGQAIDYSELKGFNEEKDLVHYLRLNTYLLSSDKGQANLPEVIAPVATENLLNDIATLPVEALLLEQGDFAVYCAGREQLPNIMQEIGRIRELSFRAVGEGSGLACDLDEYDYYYQQLFVWHNADKKIVGAYRLGFVDQLLEQKGLQALYSRSLFQYDQSFLASMGMSIEVGRSVVAEAYQKNLNSLLMLWKGIATIVSRNPQYTHLFGPVSISKDYSNCARQLMMQTLSLHHYDQQRAKLVKATTPLAKDTAEFWQPNLLSALTSVELLSKILARMEQGKGLPVLLRQYLKMNGKLICFNLDHDFNDALDGLIMVDLTKVPLKILTKYMDRTQAESYLNHQTLNTDD